MLKITDSGWTVFASAFGPIGLAWTPSGVCRLEFGRSSMAEYGAMVHVPRPRGSVAEICRLVRAHLKGQAADLSIIPVDFGARSAFSIQVWRALRAVPAGSTITYGALAAACGKPGAARAVGRIMGANPVPVIVPCHRCMGQGGQLTGFSAEGGIQLKARLLQSEGFDLNPTHTAGQKFLSRRDPIMRAIIKQVGPYMAASDTRRPAYDTLVSAIIHQQLSVKAGRTIAGRVRALTSGASFPRPEQMLELDEALLRSAGLSSAKVGYVRDLAARVNDGRLRLSGLSRLADEEVVRKLTSVRGIGRWSAHMHLIFHLGRLDVLPVDDVGLQNAAGIAYGLGGNVGASELEALGTQWTPYRSLASWYLWQSLELGGV